MPPSEDPNRRELEGMVGGGQQRHLPKLAGLHLKEGGADFRQDSDEP